MSNHLTDAQYAAFIDRLVACRQAEDDAKEDTKQVYTELAEAGEDKTAAGLIVRELRMTEKDRVKANLKGAAADSAAERYRRGKASHVRAREDDHSSDPRNMVPEHDADGVIIEPETTNGGDHGRSAVAANQSTAARMDVRVSQSGGALPSGGLAEDEGLDATQAVPLQIAGTQAPPVDTTNFISAFTIGQTEPQAAMPAQTGGAALPHSNAEAEQAPVESSAISSRAATNGSTTPSAGMGGEVDRQLITNSVAIPPVAPSTVATETSRDSANIAAVPAGGPNDYSRPNPACADPDDCGVEASWNRMCGFCLRRRAAQQHSAEAVH